MRDKCRKCNKIIGQWLSPIHKHEYCQCNKQPTPQTFEEAAEVLGVDIEKYKDGLYIELQFKDGSRGIYYNNNDLCLGDMKTEGYNIYKVSPQQAYEIISVLQRNIGVNDDE